MNVISNGILHMFNHTQHIRTEESIISSVSNTFIYPEQLKNWQWVHIAHGRWAQGWLLCPPSLYAVWLMPSAPQFDCQSDVYSLQFYNPGFRKCVKGKHWWEIEEQRKCLHAVQSHYFLSLSFHPRSDSDFSFLYLERILIYFWQFHLCIEWYIVIVFSLVTRCCSFPTSVDSFHPSTPICRCFAGSYSYVLLWLPCPYD